MPIFKNYESWPRNIILSHHHLVCPSPSLAVEGVPSTSLWLSLSLWSTISSGALKSLPGYVGHHATGSSKGPRNVICAPVVIQSSAELRDHSEEYEGPLFCRSLAVPAVRDANGENVKISPRQLSTWKTVLLFLSFFFFLNESKWTEYLKLINKKFCVLPLCPSQFNSRLLSAHSMPGIRPVASTRITLASTLSARWRLKRRCVLWQMSDTLMTFKKKKKRRKKVKKRWQWRTRKWNGRTKRTSSWTLC